MTVSRLINNEIDHELQPFLLICCRQSRDKTRESPFDLWRDTKKDAHVASSGDRRPSCFCLFSAARIRSDQNVSTRLVTISRSTETFHSFSKRKRQTWSKLLKRDAFADSKESLGSEQVTTSLWWVFLTCIDQMFHQSIVRMICSCSTRTGRLLGSVQIVGCIWSRQTCRSAARVSDPTVTSQTCQRYPSEPPLVWILPLTFVFCRLPSFKHLNKMDSLQTDAQSFTSWMNSKRTWRHFSGVCRLNCQRKSSADDKSDSTAVKTVKDSVWMWEITAHASSLSCLRFAPPLFSSPVKHWLWLCHDVGLQSRRLLQCVASLSWSPTHHHHHHHHLRPSRPTERTCHRKL